MNTDRPLGAALVVLGGTGIALAAQISVRTFNDDPGPKLFPILACSILVLCGLGLLASRPDPENDQRFERPAFLRGCAMAAILGGYALALWLLGFHAATLAGVFALYCVIAGDRRVLWRGGLYAVLVTAAVHGVFAGLLGAFLPRGLWL